MDWQQYPDEEALKNYRELKSKLDQTLKKISAAKDLRDGKVLLIEIQKEFKGLKLRREDREELYSRLQEEFARVNRQIEEERLDFEHEALLNYSELKVKVDEAMFLASNPKDFRETWDFLISVQAGFKGAKLLREHREEMYHRLQAAFDKLKAFQEKEKAGFVKEAAENYAQLKQQVEEAVERSVTTLDLRTAREILIECQNMIRPAKLTGDQRDELYETVREAFTTLNIRKEEETSRQQKSADENYLRLKPLVGEILDLAGNSAEFRQVREQFKLVQNDVRLSVLMKEQREELLNKLQEAFTMLNLRQDEEQQGFEKEARVNYERLKLLVNQGLTQAEETNQYKETREFLKKIQAEFKGIKLVREQREELYSRLQTAFDILSKRLDEFFRQKKKNWEVKMQYKLSEFTSEIYGLQDDLEKEQANLKELEDQLEIVESSGKETEAVTGLKARIASAKMSISRKEKEMLALQAGLADLKTRLETDES